MTNYIQMIAASIPLSEISINVVAGITGSIFTGIFLWIGARLSQRRCFSDYAGLYETYSIEGERLGDEIITVTWLGNNLILARSESSKGKWESYIAIDSTVPHVGNGFYQSRTGVEYGLHQIQRDHSKKTIHVFVNNPALGTPPHQYTWKKIGI